jgi:uncharacterized protein YdeI (YjbR/CyaY-like superfamily)
MRRRSTSTGGDKGPPVMLFERRKDWEGWLDKHHDSSAGIWLRIGRKTAALQSISHAEALEVALCYGWIDGQRKSHDESSWLVKFAPRGAKSIWSKVNREKAQELIDRGQMRPSGLAAVESAKRDGRWEAAYDSPSNATVPADFQTALDEHPKARAFFATLNSRNRYAILFRLQTAKKEETRRRRIEEFVRMLEAREKLYP